MARCSKVVGKVKHISLYKDWLNTGDVGYIDVYGELHVVGRSDDVIILDSHKIYPSEIEAAIVNEIGVTECVVIERNCNDKKDLVCVYSNKSPITEQRILNKLTAVLLPYEIPRFFSLVKKYHEI